ncbi:ZIP family metal transporter [Cellulophaga baltica]|uniref:ZIP family metal transporter n=1 Tax=Cellulophaga baltica 18 TaxID=1348584 RepID=A0AAU8S7N3_9FLAO|nr:ZIP family metal transporter [Cellulophaga baltica]AIZ43729.1 ZIP family metal transporter [Cellulophaga baltica 18]
MTYLLPILAVLVSFLFVYLIKPKKKEGIKLLLAFSGAFLLALTVFELLPEIYEVTDQKKVGVFVMLGILLQIFLEFFSKGAEHGHMHMDSNKTEFPWLLFISLSVHSLLEGVPIGDHHSMLYAILVHKIPIAIILSIFLIGSKMSKPSAYFFICLFSIMTPLGTYLAANIELLSTIKSELNAVAIGVFLHISTVILFESSEGHKFNLSKLLVIIIGIIIAYFL